MDGPTKGIISVFGLMAGQIGQGAGDELYKRVEHRIPPRYRTEQVRGVFAVGGMMAGVVGTMVPLVTLTNHFDRKNAR